MKSVGIDIGSFSIKVAEVDAGGKNYGAITGFTEYALSPDPRADRQLEMVEILRNVAGQYDPSTTRSVVAVPQADISLRLLRFPFKERLKILKSLAFELEDEIPLDLDDAIFEAKIVEYIGDTAEVLALACPMDSIQAVLTKYKDGGIDPDLISAEGLALANCFERWMAPPPQLPAANDADTTDANGKAIKSLVPPVDGRVVLDIGHTQTLLLAYREGALVTARSIHWGGVEVADSLAKTFAVPFSEAVKILQKKSFILMNSAGASRDQIALSTAVSKEVDHLVRQVRLTMLDLKTEYNLNFTAIDLLGGVSQIQNLPPYLTQMLEVPANIFHHFQNHRSLRIEQSPGLEPISAVAIGLALEGVKKPRNPSINFRRGEFARQNKSLQLFWERWRPALVAAGTAFFLFNVFSFVRDSIADTLMFTSEEKVTEQAAAIGLAKNQRSLSGVQRYITDTQKQINNRQILAKLDNFNSALDILQSISSNMPVGSNVGGVKMQMDIKRLNIDNDTVSIEGRVSNQAQVDAVRKALEKVALPKSVAKGASSGAAPGGVPFAYQFKVNRLSK